MAKAIVGFLILATLTFGFQIAWGSTLTSLTVEKYRLNSTIPPAIIDYFESRSGNGRILPIGCPDWIYYLPIYAGKPLIDGWYPQEKLLKPLQLEINDYKINDLSSILEEYGLDGESERDRIWLNLINNSSEFEISWVMIGYGDKNILMNGTNFKRSANFTIIDGTLLKNISIYEIVDEPSFVEVSPLEHVGKVEFSRPSPEEMKITLKDVREDIDIKVKEAYYPGWNAYVNGSKIEIGADDYGFIIFHLKKGDAYAITLSYEKETSILYWAISIAALLLLFALLKLRP